MRFFLAALLLAGAPPREAPLNIVLFVGDDHGQFAGCYGTPVIQTPALDALAAEGIRFPNAFCTTASCSPSRSVILSGMFNHANGMYGLEHDVHHFRSHETLQTMPALLAKAGYRTARIGKFHVGPEAAFPFGTVIKGNVRSPVAMADACRDFLSQQVNTPFFLYFCTVDPHRGGGMGPGPLKPNRFGNDGAPTDVVYDPKDVTVPPWLPDTPACRAELAQYYQSISRVDQGVARMVAHLKELGLWDRTVFLYISDHGAPWQGAKTTTYEPGLKVPFIVRHPAATRRGAVNEAMISHVDLAPTLMDVAGAPAAGMHGRSWLPVLDQEKPAGWDEIYASHTFHEVTMYYPMRVVRTRTHKLIWNLAHGLEMPSASDLWGAATWQDVWARGPDTPYGKRTVKTLMHRPEFELYDLAADPDEARNLAGDPAHAARMAEMKEKLKAMQKRTKDPWLLKWERE